MKFADVDALKTQMALDCADAQRVVAQVK
jgi:FAD synthase